mgnify:CR=1 FL=1
MNTYSGPEYKDLYKEILIDYNWTWGKFQPVPYPMLERIRQQTNNNSKAN